MTWHVHMCHECVNECVLAHMNSSYHIWMRYDAIIRDVTHSHEPRRTHMCQNALTCCIPHAYVTWLNPTQHSSFAAKVAGANSAADSCVAASSQNAAVHADAGHCAEQHAGNASITPPKLPYPNKANANMAPHTAESARASYPRSFGDSEGGGGEWGSPCCFGSYSTAAR